MKIQTRKMPIGAIRAINGGSIAFASYDAKTLTHEIVIPYHASTKVRLHELAHCFLGHCENNNHKGSIPVTQFIHEEIAAEIYACETCGKELSVESLINIATDLIKQKCTVSYVFNTLIYEAADSKYHLSKGQRSYLWQELVCSSKEMR